MKLTWRIWLLLILLVLSLVSIVNFSGFGGGILITHVNENSTALEQGLRQGQSITALDGKEINSLEDFSNALLGKFELNQSVKTTLTTNDGEFILFGNQPPEITVGEIPSTNIKLGLDLRGGARALVQAKDKELSSEEVSDLVGVISKRLNVYGLMDVKVQPVSDLAGNNFVLIEIAGATPNDLENLISQQGIFEAKIGNQTVFEGGQRDIASVCRNDATCAFVEGCYSDNAGGYYCNFRFSVYLSEAAAKRHADITKEIPVNVTPQGNYLSEKLDLLLDGNQVDSLLISEGLRGIVTTQISISGSGFGTTQEEAYDTAEAEMHNLQTILITGSLPYKLEIIKLDTISPTLGGDFVRSILIAGVAALIGVSIVVFVRYKNLKSSIAMILTSASEIVIILGIASVIEWNLDLPSIAGILATIGTGFDDLIVVLDESRHGTSLSLKQRLKRAFAIILGAYFTAAVSLLPLLWAGAGLLKGFAVTTLIGISVGVLITRPAFSDYVRKISE